MSTSVPQYPFDETGVAATNLVTETQAIQSRGMFDHYFIVPRSGPFYAESVRLRLYPAGSNVNNPLAGQPLVEGEHYNFGYHFAHASHTIGKPIYGAISFYDRALAGQLRMEYQTLGGTWVLDHQAMAELLANTAYNPRIATWEQLVELPHQFPVVNHNFDIDDFVGMSEVEDKLGDIEQAIIQANEGGLQQHVANEDNPHNTTKEQVGLGMVDNFPTAALVEATNGVLNNRFMTPLRTRQAIEAIAISALNAHMNNTSNPHNTTKTQVGLGNVQNYAVASQPDAEAGASNARYMTPVRTREAILAIVKNDFDAHAANRENPHQVTKAQVGLGNVANIGIADDQSAIAGQGDQGVITPRLLALVLNETLGDGVAAHVADDQNPHGTNKGHVGLGNVENYPPASEQEAIDATSNERYMTPLATRRTINALVGDASSAHVDDRNNPHGVTALQVGAYSTEQMDILLDSKLDVTGAAADAEMVYGLDQDGLEAWIGGVRSGDTVRFDGRTWNEALDEILAGKINDSDKLDGKTYNEVLEAIGQAVDGGSIQFSVYDVQELEDDMGDYVDAPVHWIKIGTIAATDTDFQADTTFLVTGARDDLVVGDRKHTTALVEISTVRDTLPGDDVLTMVTRSAVQKALTPVECPFTVGYIPKGEGLDSELEVWVKFEGPHNQLTFTELSDRKLVAESLTPPQELEDLIVDEPIGIVYCEQISDGTAEIAALLAHAADTDNPHETTKAQVGLGNVDNYGTSTDQEAIAGTATDKFMTPASTEAKVSHAIDELCDELIDVIDAAIANYFA